MCRMRGIGDCDPPDFRNPVKKWLQAEIQTAIVLAVEEQTALCDSLAFFGHIKV
jgi:hypothetical protein